MTANEFNVEEISKKDHEKISLDSLSKLTGFPLEVIQNELLLSADEINDGVTIEELRFKMLRYIDETLISK